MDASAFDQRRAPRRQALDLPVRDLDHPERRYTLRCLSRLGVRLEYGEQIKRGEILHLEFTIPPGTIRARAEVVWTGQTLDGTASIGLAFVELPGDQQETISRYAR